MGCPNLTFVSSYDCVKLGSLETIEANYQKYRKKACKKFLDTIFEELVTITWEPTRAKNWCWDEDEKKFMNEWLM
jgi:hypothetical protein